MAAAALVRAQLRLLSGLFGVLLGVLFVAVGLFLRQQTLDSLSQSARTEAVVVELLPTRGSGENVLYRPQFRFTLEDGEVIYAEGSVSANPPAHRVGDIVHVYYEVANPYNVRVDSFAELWLPSTLILIAGAVLLFLGGVSLLVLAAKLGGLAVLLALLLRRRSS